MPEQADPTSQLVAADRALVYLYVPWSICARTGMAPFRTAVERLNRDHPQLGLLSFVHDEDDDTCQAWLTRCAIDGVGGGISRGAGSILWLEQGRVVLDIIDGGRLSADEIVARSCRLWNEV